MSLFGNLGQQQMIPGYGGGMFPTTGISNASAGLDAALQQNAQGAAMPKQKNKFGEFLRMFAGNLGDSLTGNPIFAQQQQAMAEQQRMEEMYERKRRDDLSDYEARKGIDQQYSAPDLPGIADEYNWFNQQPPETQARVQEYMKMRYPGQFVPPAPVTMGAGDTVEGGGPIAVNPQTGESLRYNPNTKQWEATGGPSPGGSGGFL